MNKHTPGRWIHNDAGYGRGNDFVLDECFVARDGDDVAICADIIDPETGDPSEANARLIAAAPDLLEALSEIINDGGKFVMTHELHRKARAAIARARGEV